MEEYIKREDAIELLQKPVTMSMCCTLDECLSKRSQRQIDLELIKSLPPADVVERKKGKWINDGFYADGHSYFVFRCSECDHSTLGTQLGITGYHFCPNCGAEMESE